MLSLPRPTMLYSTLHQTKINGLYTIGPTPTLISFVVLYTIFAKLLFNHTSVHDLSATFTNYYSEVFNHHAYYLFATITYVVGYVLTVLGPSSY